MGPGCSEDWPIKCMSPGWGIEVKVRINVLPFAPLSKSVAFALRIIAYYGKSSAIPIKNDRKMKNLIHRLSEAINSLLLNVCKECWIFMS